jgi:hypothetical protein
MLKKFFTTIKDFMHKEETQENIIKVLTFARNVVAEYAILMVLQSILNLV